MINVTRQRAPLSEGPAQDSPQRAGKEPASLAIDHEGVIGDCSDNTAALFGFHRGELLGRPISLLFPQLVGIEWLEKGQPNHRVSYLAHIGHCFAALTRDGRQFASKLFVNELSNGTFSGVLLLVRPVESPLNCEGGQDVFSRGRIERNGVSRRRMAFHPLAG